MFQMLLLRDKQIATGAISNRTRSHVKQTGSTKLTLPFPGAVQAQQAAYTVQAFRAGRANEGLGPMILWNLNIATIWGAGRPESAYGLLRPNGSYRPAYLAVRVAEP